MKSLASFIPFFTCKAIISPIFNHNIENYIGSILNCLNPNLYFTTTKNVIVKTFKKIILFITPISCLDPKEEARSKNLINSLSYRALTSVGDDNLR